MAKKRKTEIDTDIPPGLLDLVTETMAQHIRACFAKAKAELSQYHVITSVHVSPDNVIDSEIEVMVPRGVNPHDVLSDLDASVRPFPTTVTYHLDEETRDSPPTWVSTGVKAPLRPLEQISGRYSIYKRGMTHAGSFYRRATRQSGHAFATGKEIVANFKDAGMRKPTSIFCRIHWNPADVKPIREG